jgi:hypothetical protein
MIVAGMQVSHTHKCAKREPVPEFGSWRLLPITALPSGNRNGTNEFGDRLVKRPGSAQLRVDYAMCVCDPAVGDGIVDRTLQRLLAKQTELFIDTPALNTSQSR